jgi:hypothetical protein
MRGWLGYGGAISGGTDPADLRWRVTVGRGRLLVCITRGLQASADFRDR